MGTNDMTYGESIKGGKATGKSFKDCQHLHISQKRRHQRSLRWNGQKGGRRLRKKQYHEKPRKSIKSYALKLSDMIKSERCPLGYQNGDYSQISYI